jgi:hypothetical protein
MRQQRNGDRWKYHSQMLVGGYFFLGFHIVVSGNVFLCLTMIQKGKEHQNTRQSDFYSEATPPRTNQIASCFDALSITYTVTFILWQYNFVLLHSTLLSFKLD